MPIGAITIATIAFLLPVPKQPLAKLPLKKKFDEVDYFGAFFLIPYRSFKSMIDVVPLSVCYWHYNGVEPSIPGIHLELLAYSSDSD